MSTKKLSEQKLENIRNQIKTIMSSKKQNNQAQKEVAACGYGR